MTYEDPDSGEEFESEDDYLRSLKQGESYEFSYPYEYVANRFGDGDNDVDLKIATLVVTFSWDDSPSPGYVHTCVVEAPTPIPNEWTGDAEQVFQDLFFAHIEDDLMNSDIPRGLYKDFP